MTDDEGLLRDTGVPSFREKLVDFVSALVLVLLTILTAWNWSLPLGPGLRAAAAGDHHPPMQYPAIPGPALTPDTAADLLFARRKPQAPTEP